MLVRLVTKSLWVRRERLLISVISVMLAAAMVTSLLTISLDIRERVGKELRSYGANIVVLPGKGEYINQFNDTYKFNATDKLDATDKSIAKRSSIIDSVPFLYFKTEVNTKKINTKKINTKKINTKNIEFAGTDLEAARKMNPWWHIEGILPKNEEVLLGINVANKLGLKVGDMLGIGNKSFKVSGILDTGTSDDNRIFIPIETAEQISDKSGATQVQMSVLGNIDEVVKYFENEGYKVKKIRQIAESEKTLLDKTQLLMALVSIFVLSAASLGLLSTMVTSVLERSREIALMKALGCGNGRLAIIFLAEAGIMGIAGGILGYFVGLSLSQVIGTKIFDVQVSIKPEVFFLTILISILVACVASLLPIRRAISIDPVTILRGE